MKDILIKLTVILALIMQAFGIMEMPNTSNDPAVPIKENEGADPVIIEDAGNTYCAYTNNRSVVIKKIVSPFDTTVIEEKEVYRVGSDGIIDNIWAPEIHKIGDKWYIISCALFDEESTPRGTMPEAKEYNGHTDYYRYGFVLESKTDDIFGEYEFKARLAPDGLNNIDGTYLKKDSKLYYVCSAYVNVAHQCIYITEMENPYTLKEGAKAVMLSRPTYSWEKEGWYVNEGPTVLYKGDEIYIVYSASGYSSGKYCMGLLTLTGDDVTNKLHWYKQPTPVFKEIKSKNIYHPGHCSFLYRADGEIYMVYHATNNPDFTASPREMYIEKLEFYNDYPLFNFEG